MLTFGNPDFVKYADAYGAKGRRIETAEALAAALEIAFREGGVQLVIVPVDYSENVRVFVEELGKSGHGGRAMKIKAAVLDAMGAEYPYAVSFGSSLGPMAASVVFKSGRPYCAPQRVPVRFPATRVASPRNRRRF